MLLETRVASPTLRPVIEMEGGERVSVRELGREGVRGECRC